MFEPRLLIFRSGLYDDRIYRGCYWKLLLLLTPAEKPIPLKDCQRNDAEAKHSIKRDNTMPHSVEDDDRETGQVGQDDRNNRQGDTRFVVGVDQKPCEKEVVKDKDESVIVPRPNWHKG